MHLEPEVEKFLSELTTRIERVFASISRSDLIANNRTWDKEAKEKVGNIVIELYQKFFKEPIQDVCYIEGRGTPKRWKKPYELFGSKGVYPDIAILSPKKIAIELDHSDIKRTELPGSRFKMALAKAAFARMSRDWDCCFVFFHNLSGKPLKPYLNNPIEKEILQKYEEEFCTKITVLPS